MKTVDKLPSMTLCAGLLTDLVLEEGVLEDAMFIPSKVEYTSISVI
jgi:hypothetical protein